MYSVGEKIGRMRPMLSRSRQLYPVDSMSTETAIRSERFPSRNFLVIDEASGMRDVIVTASPG